MNPKMGQVIEAGPGWVARGKRVRSLGKARPTIHNPRRGRPRTKRSCEARQRKMTMYGKFYAGK
jgi:hypothetical protein